jgi:4-coumarate--CoA ligase (photoactive yellow protein activation family)
LDSHAFRPETWGDETTIGGVRDTDRSATVLGADSLERVGLAERVAAFFRVYDSGLEDYLLRLGTLGEYAELVATARERGSRDITFTTSGSTGAPQPCDHAWTDLAAEVDHFRQYLEAVAGGPLQRVIALVPPHHIYGFLFSVLLPEHTGVPVLRGSEALSTAQRRALRAGDLVVGHPFVWGRLAASGRPFPPGVFGLTSTAPCDPQVARQLQDSGLGGMLEIYGASETAGVGMRTDPDLPFELLPRWERAPGAADRLLEVATGKAWPLGDHLEWAGERHFHPAGRRDRSVQVGGTNVYPQRIAASLEGLPEVEQAAVRLMAPHEGDRLKAFIVPTRSAPARDVLVRHLEAWCDAHLDAPERPRAFNFGHALPVNAMHKTGDWDA